MRRGQYDATNLDPSFKVAYVTDVEGNYEYFMAYVERAEGLRYVCDEEGGAARIELQDGWRFIFGGDAVDKGNAIGGSLRVVLTLLSMKRRYPGRVSILLGNRDLNKMRLTSEVCHASVMAPARARSLPWGDALGRHLRSPTLASPYRPPPIPALQLRPAICLSSLPHSPLPTPLTPSLAAPPHSADRLPAVCRRSCTHRSSSPLCCPTCRLPNGFRLGALSARSSSYASCSPSRCMRVPPPPTPHAPPRPPHAPPYAPPYAPPHPHGPRPHAPAACAGCSSRPGHSTRPSRVI